MAEKSSLRDLAILFLRLGATSFGGPAVHIAMMEEEVVRRRRWLTSEQFLDMLAATNFIPGPNSTEMAIHIGYQRAGLLGLAVAGVSFILPAFLVVLALAALYQHFGGLPLVGGILYGMKPVVIVVVMQAIAHLAKSSLKDRKSMLLAATALVAQVAGAGEVAVLAGAATVSAVAGTVTKRGTRLYSAIIPVIGPVVASISTVTSLLPSQIFLTFLKIGSVLFGSGYVLFAFLHSEFIERLHLLSETQLLDAVAIGQITPGPVFTAATFIGYLLLGMDGALAATAGIFLPAFFFVALSAPLLPRLRESRVIGDMLDGLQAASLALMAVVAIYLGQAAIIDIISAVLFIVSAALLIRWKLNPTWIMLVGGLVGGLKIELIG